MGSVMLARIWIKTLSSEILNQLKRILIKIRTIKKLKKILMKVIKKDIVFLFWIISRENDYYK